MRHIHIKSQYDRVLTMCNYATVSDIMRICQCCYATGYRIMARHACAIVHDPLVRRKPYRVMSRADLIQWFGSYNPRRGNPHFCDYAYQQHLADKRKQRRRL